MYIILRDRLNQYRSFVTVVRRILPPRDAVAGKEGFSLTIQNPCDKPFFDLEFYFQANAVLRSYETRPVGCYFYLAQLGTHKTYIDTIFQDVKTFDVSEKAVLVYLITDTAGRKWLVERRKPAKLVTWRNSKQVDRKTERLKSGIKEKTGDHYIRPRRERSRSLWR